jgi:serine protease Do
MRGEVLGINTAYLGRGTSIGFSIPSNLAHEMFKQLAESHSVSRGYLGIHVQAVDQRIARYFKLDKPHGALTTKVDPKSPAASAGMLPGDIVTAYGAILVTDAFDLLDRIERSRPGDDVSLRVLRGGAALTLSMHVKKAEPVNAEDDDEPAPKRDPNSLLGLKLRSLTPLLRQQTGYQGGGSVVVENVVPGSPAERAGIHTGLAILQADMRPVAAPRDMIEPLGDGRVLLLVEDSEGETTYVLVQSD